MAEETASDIASLTGIKALKDLLTTGSLATVDADLTALLTQTGTGTIIGQNIGQILNTVRNTLANAEREIVRIQPLADAAAETPT